MLLCHILLQVCLMNMSLFCWKLKSSFVLLAIAYRAIPVFWVCHIRWHFLSLLSTYSIPQQFQTPSSPWKYHGVYLLCSCTCNSLWLCEYPFSAQLWNNQSFKTQPNEAFPDSLGTTNHSLLYYHSTSIFSHSTAIFLVLHSDLLGGADYVLLNLSLQYLV